MRFNIKILETDSQINIAIVKALLPEVTSFMNKGIVLVKSELPIIIYDSIVNTPEYNSLQNGQLKYEFGIPDVSSKLAGLLNIWSNNIQYQYLKPTISNNKIKTTFIANTIRVDFADVLYTDYALVIDSTRGYSIPWLEWLLLDGNKILVNKSNVVLGPNKYSRTGNALMKPSNKSWKVPSEFSGTQNDNWITRAIDGASDKINNLLIKAFKL